MFQLKLSKTITTPRETKRKITSVFYSLKLDTDTSTPTYRGLRRETLVSAAAGAHKRQNAFCCLADDTRKKKKLYNNDCSTELLYLFFYTLRLE
jgi:hypothetical protein